MGTNQKPVLRPLQSEGTIDSQSTLESSGSMPERLRLISAERQRANHGAKPLVTLERLPAFGRRRFQKMTLDTYPANLNLYNQFRKALEQENEIALLPEVEARLVQFEDADLRALYAQAQQRIGNLEVALQEAERAFGAKRSSTTLYSTGFIRGLTDPQAGLALLHQGLCSAEMESDLEACVRCATGISLLLTRLGQYTSATDWAQWGFRGLGAVQPRLRFSALCALASAHSLGGIAQGIDMLIAEFEENLEISPRIDLERILVVSDLRRAKGEDKQATESCMTAWRTNRNRAGIAAISRRLSLGLVEAGCHKEACEIARQALELSVGLPDQITDQALVASGIAHLRHDPVYAATTFQNVMTRCQNFSNAPLLAQVGLFLARARLTLGDIAGAKNALEVARPGLKQLTAVGWRVLAGSVGWEEVIALLEGREPTTQLQAVRLELRFLGSSEIRLDGQILPLRRRFAEILAVLAMHPQGLSGDQLTLAVYGESGTLECCKTELSRLRQIVPILTRPYRLGLSMRADFLDLEQHLACGETEAAFALHNGVLLSESDAPEIVHTREQLEETLRFAAIRTQNPDVLLCLAEQAGEDLDLWQAALRALERADPRRALANARVNHLRKAWGV